MSIPATLSSVPATTPYIQYVATSGQTVFPYPFVITQDSDLVVVANGTTLDTDSGYTTSGVGNSTGGNVTFTSGRAAGDIITLYRDIPIERLTQFAQNGGFSSTAFNAEFNNVYLLLQQLQQNIDQCLQIPNTNNPAPTVSLTPASYANKYLAFDANGNPTPALLTTSGAVTQSLINGLIQAEQLYETAAGITPSNLNYPPGDLRRYGGSADSGVTDNTQPLQKALNACAGNVPVVIDATDGGYFGNINGLVNVPAGSHIIFVGGSELRWATTSTTGAPTIGGVSVRPGLNITGSDVVIEGRGTITGPSGSNVYTASEIGICAVGTSAAAPYTDITIKGVEVRWWGSDGIEFKWCERITTRDNYVHDCGYAGMHFLTCTTIEVCNNEVGPIEPGSTNAYGISFTWDSSSGANTGTRSEANHYCIGVECSGNFVHDIPLWEGIDAHGLFDGHVHHNDIYNCWTGIQVASGTATDPPGSNNSIEFNNIYLAQYNGSATTVVASTAYGITVNGISGALHSGLRIVGNLINGFGNTASPATAFSIQATFVDGAIIANNDIQNWQGYGIYSGAGNGGIISGNRFGAVGSTSTNDSCVYIANAAKPWVFVGNQHDPGSGTAAHFGTSVLTTAAACFYGPNDFSAAQTAQYGNTVGGALAQADMAVQAQPFLGPSMTVTGGVAMNGVASPPAQSTGYGTPTGNAKQASFSASSITLPNLAAEVAQLVIDLKAIGIIGV